MHVYVEVVKNTNIVVYQKALYLDLKNNNMEIMKAICLSYNINEAQLKTKSRKQKYVEPRQICMYFMRLSGMTFQKIGNEFNKKHDTVIHSCNIVKFQINKYKNYRERIKTIEELIN